ncbi:GNAT family N-acetyltransferase [Baekduia sp. Peel2402]|uniref:GNAT family N-acetyltransferase n=1 Tax=Baekduia sp. Peel2402 TaxID=3458296 RepID=UPI00403ED732
MMADRLPTRVWYLEMNDPERLRPAAPREGVEVVRAEIPLGPLNRMMYLEIGRGHHWVDRREDSAEQWQAHAEAVETWLALVRGTPAGYAELRADADGAGAVEVWTFGILAPFRGQGAGGVLLTAAIERAWGMDATRVTVNTCELDGPHALDHYRSRGFALVREAEELRGREPEA